MRIVIITVVILISEGIWFLSKPIIKDVLQEEEHG